MSAWSKRPSPSSRRSNTPARKRWRRAVLERDDHQCRLRLSERCTGEATQADHIVPISVDPDRELDIDNGIACCKPCHGVKTGKEASERAKIVLARRSGRRQPYIHPADMLCGD